MKTDLIIKGKYILPMDKKLTVIKDGAVAIKADKIIKVGNFENIKQEFSADKVMDFKNSIIIPGFINTHTHIAMTYFRGIADDLPLKKWLEKRIWPAEDKYLNAKFIKNSSELACLEMLKSGVTAFNDMYFFTDATARVCEKTGIRCMLGEAIISFSTASCKNYKESIKKTKDLFNIYKNNGFIYPAVNVHSIYTCNRETLLSAKELSDNNNIPIHIHIGETKEEVANCQAEFGKSPVAYLDEINFLSDKVISAHDIWLSDEDLSIYKKRGVKVSHCPVSNMKLASGVAPINKMIKKGIVVSLGTDSAASNNTLDMFSEMRACALLHKVYNLNSTFLSAQTILKIATINGAKALGIDNKIGSLEKGKQADLISINLDKPHFQPIYDPYSHIVYCANQEDVENVIINGNLIMENRKIKTMDEEKILIKAKEFSLNFKL